jgi:hypothetical protein
VSKTLLITGLTLTVVGVLVLAWLDLTARPPTYDTLASEWQPRRRLAWLGFPMIGVGTIFQIVGVAFS